MASALLTSLRAYYKLDGNPNDALGTYNAANNGNTYGAGKIGQGAYFVSASSQRIDLPSNALPTGNSARTFACWADPTYTTNNVGNVMIGGGSNAYGQDFSFAINMGGGVSGQMRLYVRRYVNDQRSVDVKSLLDDGASHLIGVTYNGVSTGTTNFNSGIRFWLDGVEIERDTSSGWNANVSFNTTNASRMIGGPGAGFNYFDGMIDEVGIWDRALTSDDWTELFNGGAGLTYPFIPIFTPKVIMF